MKSDSIIYDIKTTNSVWQRVLGSADDKAPEKPCTISSFLSRETGLMALYRKAVKMSAGKMRALFTKLANAKASQCRALTVRHFIATGETFDIKASPPPVFSLSCALRTAYKAEEELSRKYAQSARLEEDKSLSQLYVNLSHQSEQSAASIMQTISSFLGQMY